MRQRMGMAGSGTSGANAQGTDPTHSVPDTRGSLRLLAELPAHLSEMAVFALATGLRKANVTGLQWTQVDLVRRLAMDSSGSGQSAKGDCGAP